MAPSLKHAFIINGLWLLFSFVLYFATAYLIIANDMFIWSPKLDQTTLILISVILMTLIAIFFLTQHTKEKFEIWLSFVTVCLLAIQGGFIIFDYFNHNPDALFSRKQSPLWFLISTSSIFFIPVLFHLYNVKLLKSLSINH